MLVHVSKQRTIWLAIASSKQPTFMPNKDGWTLGLVFIVETVICRSDLPRICVNLDDGSARPCGHLN